jgi:hypothetical protein
MKAMGGTAGAALGGSARPTSQSQTGLHKSFWLSYPAARRQGSGVGPEILLDMGIRGGPQPTERLAIGCLLGDLLQDAGMSLGAFDDLQPFEVAVLHPGRTLLEKLGLSIRSSARTRLMRWPDVTRATITTSISCLATTTRLPYYGIGPQSSRSCGASAT